MKKVIFVCHGNICRSPAAEWIFKQRLIKYHLDDKFEVISRATSTEEIGNDMYPPMKRALYNKEIPFFSHRSKQISQSDYDEADYIFYMDNNNLRWLSHLVDDYKNIIKPITYYTKDIEFIDDPWYTGQFDEVVTQIEECVEDIIRNIK